MSTRTRAKEVMYAFSQGIPCQYESNVANALREAVEGLNIEPNPDIELSIEKHHFIRGQLFVKAALLRLATELENMSEE